MGLLKDFVRYRFKDVDLRFIIVICILVLQICSIDAQPRYNNVQSGSQTQYTINRAGTQQGNSVVVNSRSSGNNNNQFQQRVNFIQGNQNGQQSTFQNPNSFRGNNVHFENQGNSGNFGNSRTIVIGNNGNVQNQNQNVQYQNGPIVNQVNSRNIVNSNGFNPRIGGIRNIPQRHVINSQNGGNVNFNNVQQTNQVSNMQPQTATIIHAGNGQNPAVTSNEQVILIRGNDGQLRLLQPASQTGQEQYVLRQTVQVVTPSPVAEPINHVLGPLTAGKITGKSAAVPAPSIQIVSKPNDPQPLVVAGNPVIIDQAKDVINAKNDVPKDVIADPTKPETVVTEYTSKVASGADLKAQEASKPVEAKVKDVVSADHKALGIAVPGDPHQAPGHGHAAPGHGHDALSSHPGLGHDPHHPNTLPSPLGSLSRALLGRMGAMGAMGPMGLGGLSRASALFGHPMSMRRQFGPFGMMDPFMGGPFGPMMDIGDTTDPPDPSEMPRPTKQSEPGSTTREGRRGRGRERGGRRRGRGRSRRPPRRREHEPEEIELEDLPPTTTTTTTTTTTRPTTTTTKPTTDSTKLVLSLAEKLISFFAGSMERERAMRYPGATLEVMKPDSVVDPIPQKEAIIEKPVIPVPEDTTPFTVTEPVPLEVPTKPPEKKIVELTPIEEVVQAEVVPKEPAPEEPAPTEPPPTEPPPTEPRPTDPPIPEIVHEPVHQEVPHVHHSVEQAIPEPKPDPEAIQQAKDNVKATKILTEQLGIGLAKAHADPALLAAPEAEITRHVVESAPAADVQPISTSENGDPSKAENILSKELQIGMEVVAGGDPNISPVNLETVHVEHAVPLVEHSVVNAEIVTPPSKGPFVTVPQAKIVLPEETAPVDLSIQGPLLEHAPPVEPQPEPVLHTQIVYEPPPVPPAQEPLPQQSLPYHKLSPPAQEPLQQAQPQLMKKAVIFVTPKSNSKRAMLFVTPRRPKVPIPAGSHQMFQKQSISAPLQRQALPVSNVQQYSPNNQRVMGQASSAAASPIARQPFQNSQASSAAASPVARLPIPYVKRPEPQQQIVRYNQRQNVGVRRPLVVNVRTQNQAYNRPAVINNRTPIIATRQNGKLTLYVKRKPENQGQQIQIQQQQQQQQIQQQQLQHQIQIQRQRQQQHQIPIRQPQPSMINQPVHVENIQTIQAPIVEPEPNVGGIPVQHQEEDSSSQVHIETVHTPIAHHIETIVETPISQGQLADAHSELLTEQISPSVESIIEHLVSVPEGQILEGPPPDAEEMVPKSITKTKIDNPTVTKPIAKTVIPSKTAARNSIAVKSQPKANPVQPITKPQPPIQKPVMTVKTQVKAVQKPVQRPVQTIRKQVQQPVESVQKNVQKPAAKPIVTKPKQVIEQVQQPTPPVKKAAPVIQNTKPIATEPKTTAVKSNPKSEPVRPVEQIPKPEMLALASFESKNEIGGVAIQKVEKTPKQKAADAQTAATGGGDSVHSLLAGLKELLVSHKNSDTTPEPCTPKSPNFKCRGKDLFNQMENMDAWCLGMCLKEGCVERVCTCGCDLPPSPTSTSPSGRPFGPGRRGRLGPRGGRRRGRFGRRRPGQQRYRSTTMPTTTEATEEPPEEEEVEYEAEDGTTTMKPTTPSSDYNGHDYYYYDYDYGVQGGGNGHSHSHVHSHSHDHGHGHSHDFGPTTPMSPSADFQLTPLDQHSTQMKKIGPHVDQIKNVAWASDRLPNLAEAQVSNTSFGGLSKMKKEGPPPTPEIFRDRDPSRRPNWSGTRWELPPAPTKPPKRQNWSRRRLRNKWSRGSNFNNDNRWNQPQDNWSNEFNNRGMDNRLSRLRFTWSRSGGGGEGGGEEEGADK